MCSTMWKNILVIGLAYFGFTVGAGFASRQEMLQYYVSYGTGGCGRHHRPFPHAVYSNGHPAIRQ